MGVMVRGLRRILVAMALLMLLGTIACWVRSYWVEDQFWWKSYTQPKAERRQEFRLETWSGRVTIAYQRCVPRRYGDKPMFVWNSEPAESGWSGEFDFEGRKTVLGFGALSFDIPRGGTQSGDEEQDQEWDVLFPFWFVTLLLGIPSALWLRGVWKRTRGVRRDRLGLCVQCGYDLRASTGCCPECGREIKTPARIAQSTWSREL